MSTTLTRFSFNPSVHYQGLEDSAPDEVREFARALINRLEATQGALLNAMRLQLIADQSPLPTQTRGEVSAATTTIATEQDLEQSILLNMML